MLLLKIILYSLIIVWGALVLFAFKNIKKALLKYRNIREVDDNICNWQGSKRTDFNKWDQKALIRGCLFRFPFKFLIMLFDLTLFALAGLLQHSLRKIYRHFDKILMKYIGFPFLGRVYEIVEHQPISMIKTPIVISNHVCWFDIAYHCIKFFPISFVSKAEMQKVFVLGKVAKNIQCVFLDRESSKDRNATLQKIQNQIISYNSDPEKFNPIVIFPEATTSNGRSILKFKIGAFQNKAKITIVSFNYSCQGFDMGMDEVTPVEHFIITLCLNARLQVRFKEMESSPEESPEQYMSRCQKELSSMTGFPIQQTGYTEKNKLKQERFGKKDS